ncbi:MAG: hypothetical protein J6Y29_00780, partial [Clostridiales bacterium]|nr:hypothetical protein [Clostridiales bacterium]
NAMFAIPVENLPIEFTFSFPFHTVIDLTTVSALILKTQFQTGLQGNIVYLVDKIFMKLYNVPN